MLDDRDELRHGEIGWCERHRVRVIDDDCPQCDVDVQIDDAINLADGNSDDE